SPLRIRLVELYMWLGYRLKRMGFPGLYRYSYRMDYEINMKDGGAAHLEAARDLARQGYDVVVFGHTHVERHVELRGGGTYINTGDCLRRRMYASLDLERRECRLVEFPGRPTSPGPETQPRRRPRLTRGSATSRRPGPPACPRPDRAPSPPRARWR